MLTVSKIVSNISHDIPVFRISYEEFKDHIRWMAFQEGKLYAVYGTMGTGKTNFALRVAEDLWHVNNQMMFLTNITVNHPRFKYSNKASDLLLYLSTYKTPFVVLDDSTTFYSSTEAVSQRKRNMDNLIVIIRKFRANILFVAHVRQYIPRFVKEYGEWIIKKRSKMVAEMDPYIIEDIPPTGLEYNTYEIGSFTFDIDMSAVLEVISGISNEEEMRKKLVQFLDDWKKEKSEEQLKNDYRYWLAKAAYMLKETRRINYAEFARTLGIQPDTLRQWIKRYYRSET